MSFPQCIKCLNIDLIIQMSSWSSKFVLQMISGRHVRSKTVRVPLTPGSKLAWLGTTDVGSPCAYDNKGILRMYDIASGIWMPLCDTNTHSRGVSDSWFIVSVSKLLLDLSIRFLPLGMNRCWLACTNATRLEGRLLGAGWLFLLDRLTLYHSTLISRPQHPECLHSGLN